jgi:ABC-type transporter Mla subunit MlaD
VDAQFWTAVFVGITAFSFLLQSLAIWGIYGRLKQVTARVDELSGDVKNKLASVSENVQQVLNAAKPILETTQKLNENLVSVSAMVKHRAIDVDRFAQETTDTLRTQLARIDEVVDTTSRKIQHVVATWHQGVITPAFELAALIKGVKTGFEFFFSRKTGRTPSRSQQDDELFI